MDKEELEFREYFDSMNTAMLSLGLAIDVKREVRQEILQNR